MIATQFRCAHYACRHCQRFIVNEKCRPHRLLHLLSTLVSHLERTRNICFHFCFGKKQKNGKEMEMHLPQRKYIFASDRSMACLCALASIAYANKIQRNLRSQNKIMLKNFTFFSSWQKEWTNKSNAHRNKLNAIALSRSLSSMADGNCCSDSVKKQKCNFFLWILQEKNKWEMSEMKISNEIYFWVKEMSNKFYVLRCFDRTHLCVNWSGTFRNRKRPRKGEMKQQHLIESSFVAKEHEKCSNWRRWRRMKSLHFFVHLFG